MSSTNGAGIEKGSGINPRYKTRCPRCYWSEYTVVEVLKKRDVRYVVRRCEACFHEWHVSSYPEYEEFKFNQRATSTKEE